MKRQAYILKTDGSKVPCSPKNGRDFHLEELKDAIGGGWIEIVYLKQRLLMVIDEEGKLKQLPLNYAATKLYNNSSDVIVGDALVCSSSMIK